MLTFLLWASLVAVLLFLAMALTGYLVSITVMKANRKRARGLLGPAGPQDVEEAAILAKGGKGFGLLRLTPQELQFGNAATLQVIRIPRTEISVATSTTDLGDDGEELPSPVLMVICGPPDALVETAFAVSHPEEWVARLDRGLPPDTGELDDGPAGPGTTS